MLIDVDVVEIVVERGPGTEAVGRIIMGGNSSGGVRLGHRNPALSREREQPVDIGAPAVVKSRRDPVAWSVRIVEAPGLDELAGEAIIRLELASVPDQLRGDLQVPPLLW